MWEEVAMQCSLAASFCVCATNSREVLYMQQEEIKRRENYKVYVEGKRKQKTETPIFISYHIM